MSLGAKYFLGLLVTHVIYGRSSKLLRSDHSERYIRPKKGWRRYGWRRWREKKPWLIPRGGADELETNVLEGQINKWSLFYICKISSNFPSRNSRLG